jgi:mercuric ion transport protein
MAENNNTRANNNIQFSSRGRVSRVIFAGLAWVFVASVVVQTLLAGMAIFNDPIHWNKHIVFVRIFEFIPFAMLICAFIGRMPSSMKWMSFALYGLIFVQYTTANVPAVGALHPVIALGLIVLSLHIAKRGTRSVREKM